MRLTPKERALIRHAHQRWQGAIVLEIPGAFFVYQWDGGRAMFGGYYPDPVHEVYVRPVMSAKAFEVMEPSATVKVERLVIAWKRIIDPPSGQEFLLWAEDPDAHVETVAQAMRDVWVENAIGVKDIEFWPAVLAALIPHYGHAS